MHVAKGHLAPGGIMAIIALPVRSSDIAPIFDLSRRIVLVDLENQNGPRAIDLFVHRLSVAGRIEALSRAGVGTLICGCISADAYRMLKKSGIRVIWGVSGPIEDVVAAFASNQLDESAFCVLPHKDSHFQPHKHAWAL
jgi:predicted Fe-Mo cluster-binding NifX family protein